MKEPDWAAAGVVLGQPDEPKAHPAGTIVALAREAGRFTAFSVCLSKLAWPHNTVLKWSVGSDVSGARNDACASFEGEWLWFIDDDHSFRPETLLALLERDVDIITPLCLRRTSPFLPVAAAEGNFLDIRKHPVGTLVEVEHAGSSGMLIRRRVLEAMEAPWFELGYTEDGRRLSEDVTFCLLAREAGFKVHVDMAVPIGHLIVAEVWPQWNPEREEWATVLSAANNTATVWIGAAELPDPEPEPEGTEAPVVG